MEVREKTIWKGDLKKIEGTPAQLRKEIGGERRKEKQEVLENEINQIMSMNDCHMTIT